MIIHLVACGAIEEEQTNQSRKKNELHNNLVGTWFSHPKSDIPDLVLFKNGSYVEEVRTSAVRFGKWDVEEKGGQTMLMRNLKKNGEYKNFFYAYVKGDSLFGVNNQKLHKRKGKTTDWQARVFAQAANKRYNAGEHEDKNAALLDLVESGIDVNWNIRWKQELEKSKITATSENWETVLTISLEGGFPEVAESILMTRKPDLSIQGYRALRFALIKGYVRVAKLLISQGIRIEEFQPIYVELLRLHLDKNATENKEMVELLIEYGADVNHIDQTGNTPLMHAVIGGKPKIVEYLILKGANQDLKNPQSKTALDIAKLKQKAVKQYKRTVFDGNNEIDKVDRLVALLSPSK